MKKNLITNRAKYAHVLTGIASAIATMWATDQKFRSTLTADLQHMPHWVQSLIGLAAFVIPLYKTTRKLLAGDGRGTAQ
ncbi:MAG TPA: hypothetical protein VK604_01345 [Bryobacteraceae bacterium]|nr:hypothetical protein [Bryobacteraceae bacterium]